VGRKIKLTDLEAAERELAARLPIEARQERLSRWVVLLETDPDRQLNSLQALDQPDHIRKFVRRRDSAISVAHEDATLKAAGLKGDTFGEAMEFFGLSADQLRDIVCASYFGAHATASRIADCVRTTMAYPRKSLGAGIAASAAL
jgi:hypothetical protein